MLTLVLGGAKSGKTKWALRYAESFSQFPHYIYLATALPTDEEMKAKIKKHQEERSAKWSTLEEPLEISSKIYSLKDKPSLILVDCLTLWISNLLHYNKNLEEYLNNFIEVLKIIRSNKDVLLILISNEVGLGLVPENRLGRLFRELSGELNQRIANISDEVYFIVAGLPIVLKGKGNVPKIGTF